MATSVHRVEVEVSADGSASALPSGAAAVAPPAGAQLARELLLLYILLAPPGTKKNAQLILCICWTSMGVGGRIL
jgi:hypothetical protein